MVVLAVTWMAKAGREAEVGELFAKLMGESRKEPGCVFYQVHRPGPNLADFSSTNNIRMMPRWKPTVQRRTLYNTSRKNCPNLRIGWKEICTSRWNRADASRNLKSLGPFPRAVKDAQNLHLSPANPIGNDIWSARDNELTCARHSSSPPHRWILCEIVH